MKLSFGASYIKSVDVIKKQGKTFSPEKASFVELDVKDPKDAKALDGIISDWGDESYMQFAWDIVEGKPSDDLVKHHIYAVTSQKDSFENLDKNKILGAVVFDEGKKVNEIEALQVQPDNLGTSANNGYKKVGTSIVGTLQGMFATKPMEVTSAHDAIGFYQKCGFEPKNQNLRYVWNA
ncbi:hypothetical protein IKA92_04385 [bacterium]|nr:hypothetical protein [bacterium]